MWTPSNEMHMQSWQWDVMQSSPWHIQTGGLQDDSQGGCCLHYSLKETLIWSQSHQPGRPWQALKPPTPFELKCHIFEHMKEKYQKIQLLDALWISIRKTVQKGIHLTIQSTLKCATSEMLLSTLSASCLRYQAVLGLWGVKASVRHRWGAVKFLVAESRSEQSKCLLLPL